MKKVVSFVAAASFALSSAVTSWALSPTPVSARPSLEDPCAWGNLNRKYHNHRNLVLNEWTKADKDLGEEAGKEMIKSLIEGWAASSVAGLDYRVALSAVFGTGVIYVRESFNLNWDYWTALSDLRDQFNQDIQGCAAAEPSFKYSADIKPRDKSRCTMPSQVRAGDSHVVDWGICNRTILLNKGCLSREEALEARAQSTKVWRIVDRSLAKTLELSPEERGGAQNAVREAKGELDLSIRKASLC